MAQNPELVMESLARAIQRGVTIRLLIRQRNAYASQMADLLRACVEFLGLPVLEHRYAHTILWAVAKRTGPVVHVDRRWNATERPRRRFRFLRSVRKGVTIPARLDQGL
jgi:hypothetical protein